MKRYMLAVLLAGLTGAVEANHFMGIGLGKVLFGGSLSGLVGLGAWYGLQDQSKQEELKKKFQDREKELSEIFYKSEVGQRIMATGDSVSSSRCLKKASDYIGHMYSQPVPKSVKVMGGVACSVVFWKYRWVRYSVLAGTSLWGAFSEPDTWQKPKTDKELVNAAVANCEQEIDKQVKAQEEELQVCFKQEHLKKNTELEEQAQRDLEQRRKELEAEYQEKVEKAYSESSTSTT